MALVASAPGRLALPSHEPATLRAAPRVAARVALRSGKRNGTPLTAAAAAAVIAAGARRPRTARAAAEGKEAGKEEAKPEGPKAEAAAAESSTAPAGLDKTSPAEMRQQLAESSAPPGGFQQLSEGQRSAVSGFFFPDSEELDMDKSMPLEDHIKELRDGFFRALGALIVSVGTCLVFYKELTTYLEGPVRVLGVKLVQLGPGEFFFVSVKAAVAVGFLLAFPYALFEAALYFTPALTRSERGIVGPVVLASSMLFYAGSAFAFTVLSPAALGFFVSYSEDLIESQFSIDQYFEFILSMGFATGLAFQVPVLQVTLGLLNIIKSEQLFSVWRYVVVASAVVGAVLTPSTDPVTQLLLSGALCALYFAGAGTLVALGR